MVLRELDFVDDDTPLVTTVHEAQVVAEAPAPAAHDVPMDLLVTPEHVVRTEGGEKPSGIDWSLLSAEWISEIPVLGRFR